MTLNVLLPADYVREKFLKPAGLPVGLLDEIPVHRWAGENNHFPLYDQATIRSFLKERRPESNAAESFPLEEDTTMVALTDEDSLARIAASLESIVASMVPKVEAKPEVDKDRIYNTAQAAALLKRHADVVRQYCRDGVFGCRDASGKWVIKHSEIERFRTGQYVVRGRAAS